MNAVDFIVGAVLQNPARKTKINPSAARPAQFHHERREGHEVLKESMRVIFLRALRVLRGEKFRRRKSGFGQSGVPEHQKNCPLCPAFHLNHSFVEKISMGCIHLY
jgi:hypothetical protein